MLSLWRARREPRKSSHRPYAGQETRPIKSLSPDDLAELKRGGGWGLAKSAELNGLPGPGHLLELKGRIPLTEDQVMAITAIFVDMRAAAIAEGERLIARDQALENGVQGCQSDRPVAARNADRDRAGPAPRCAIRIWRRI